MKIQDLLHEVFNAVYGNKVRSALTVLGIVIGIGSVISMISIGEGAQKSIEDNVKSIGSNLIFITPGFSRTPGPVSGGRGGAQSLTMEDNDAIIKEIKNIVAVAPDVSRRYQVIYKKQNTNTQIIGTTPSYEKVRNVQVEDGRFINDSEIVSGAKVAIIGATTKTDLFGEDEVIGRKIKINNIEFKVIGFTKAATTGGGFGQSDDRIFIPITTFKKVLNDDKYINSISVSAKDSGESMTLAQAEINTLLLKKHKIKEGAQPDFSINNQAELANTASSITGIFTILLSSIAAISLVVGGIGIMNMMLTSVTERTKEIGLRKAIGAKEKDISRQFLLEAVFLTLIGGVFGILLGWLISYGISTFAGISTSVSTYAIVLSLGVSSLIGIVFGYYPARRASKMNPIDALRYE
jgi:putative ABC transport system permease protein